MAMKSNVHNLQMELTVTSHCKAVKYRLQTYAIDAFVSKTEGYMTHFAQIQNKQPTEQTEAVWNKSIRCNRLYEKYVLNATSTGCSQNSNTLQHSEKTDIGLEIVDAEAGSANKVEMST